MSRLILLRHGESEWNAGNLFTGRADISLTSRGEQQARAAGRLLRALGLLPDAAHSSSLRRARRTRALTMAAAGRAHAPAMAAHALDERDYGSLQGRDRRAVREEFGEEGFWRIHRSLEGRPPGGESLADVSRRLLPYWRTRISPGLAAGETVLVVGHSNSLRMLGAHLDDLRPDELDRFELPPGTPLLYELDANLRPLRRGGVPLAPTTGSGRAAVPAADGGPDFGRGNRTR